MDCEKGAKVASKYLTCSVCVLPGNNFLTGKK